MVDMKSTRYEIANRYMIRLRPSDFEDPQQLARLAATAQLEPEAFRAQFGALVGA